MNNSRASSCEEVEEDDDDDACHDPSVKVVAYKQQKVPASPGHV